MSLYNFKFWSTSLYISDFHLQPSNLYKKVRVNMFYLCEYSWTYVQGLNMHLGVFFTGLAPKYYKALKYESSEQKGP